MVTGPKGLAAPYVWALKTDGTIWCAGGYNGGLGTTELEFRPVFTKASDETFLIIFNYNDTLFGLKDALDSYDLYMSDGAGGLEFYMNLSEADFATAIEGNATPEQYASSAQGMGSPGVPSMYGYMFIGGDPYLDTFSKEVGTLWYVPNSDEVNQLRPGTSDWVFAAGTAGDNSHIVISSVAV